MRSILRSVGAQRVFERANRAFLMSATTSDSTRVSSPPGSGRSCISPRSRRGIWTHPGFTAARTLGRNRSCGRRRAHGTTPSLRFGKTPDRYTCAILPVPTPSVSRFSSRVQSPMAHPEVAGRIEADPGPRVVGTPPIRRARTFAIADERSFVRFDYSRAPRRLRARTKRESAASCPRKTGVRSHSCVR